MADHGMARVVSAHNPLFACLVEGADFDGIWASGFELSPSQALPDVSPISLE
jgi:phosphoenolpyruvate phosphomutase